MSAGPGYLVAFVDDTEEPEGPILYCGGEIAEEMKQAGSRFLDDYQFGARPPRTGLLAFEGWVQVGYGDDPDVELVGAWRELTHWEMCQVRFGKDPYEVRVPEPPTEKRYPALEPDASLLAEMVERFEGSSYVWTTLSFDGGLVMVQVSKNGLLAFSTEKVPIGEAYRQVLAKDWSK